MTLVHLSIVLQAGPLLILMAVSPVHAQLSTVKVTDATGAPVQGATACFGSPINLSAYGHGVTDPFGNAQFRAVLPDGSIGVHVTASKDGRGASVVRHIAAPSTVTVEVALPPEPGGPTCSTGAGRTESPASFLQGMVIDPRATLRAGHIFEIQLMLDRPPPGPVPVVLEASNRRLVSLPDRIIFERGEQTKIVKAQISRDALRAEYVTIQAFLERNRAQMVQQRLLIGVESYDRAVPDRRD